MILLIQYYEFVDLVDLSRGLWLCWNPNTSTLDVIMKNDRMFHCMVYIPNHNINYFVTFVYEYRQHYKQKNDL